MREAKGILISEEAFRRKNCRQKNCGRTASYYVIEKKRPKRVLDAYCNRDSAEWVESGLTRKRRKPLDAAAVKK